MKSLFCLLAAFAFFTDLSEVRAQSKEPHAKESRKDEGFAQTVSRLLGAMQGNWEIKSAYLRGAELPLDQFQSLSVDESGFTLGIQKKHRRFNFQEFHLRTRSFLASCQNEDYPDGLVYEISVSDGVIKIRYRTDGAHVPPAQNVEDEQLLVQNWVKRSEE